MLRKLTQIILLAAGLVFASSLADAQEAGNASSLAPDGPHQAPRLPPAPAPTAKFPDTGATAAGGINSRTTVNQSELPWSAIGRLKAGRASCTASLVGPSLLLTAAHCVFDPQTQRLFPAQGLHFMLGYSQGRYVAEAWGIRITTGNAYDPTRATATTGDDWAIVELDHPIGTPDRILALLARSPTAGDLIALGGYSQERSEILMVDSQCHVLGSRFDRNGVSVIHHDCTANHGVSGAPLLIKDGAVWVIAGIEAVGSSPNDGGAVKLDSLRATMEQLAR